MTWGHFEYDTTPWGFIVLVHLTLNQLQIYPRQVCNYYENWAHPS